MLVKLAAIEQRALTFLLEQAVARKTFVTDTHNEVIIPEEVFVLLRRRFREYNLDLAKRRLEALKGKVRP